MVRRRERGNRTLSTMFILCEGEVTEPNYFRMFRMDGTTLSVNPGRRSHDRNDVVGLREWAEDIMGHPQFRKGRDRVWIVSDKDENSQPRLNEVRRWCQANDVGFAYSNPCFEYWLLLHFKYDVSCQNKEDLYGDLAGCIGHTYRKNADYSRALVDRIPVAMRNARTLRKGLGPESYCDHNPFTSVDVLVDEILRSGCSI